MPTGTPCPVTTTANFASDQKSASNRSNTTTTLLLLKVGWIFIFLDLTSMRGFFTVASSVSHFSSNILLRLNVCFLIDSCFRPIILKVLLLPRSQAISMKLCFHSITWHVRNLGCAPPECR